MQLLGYLLVFFVALLSAHTITPIVRKQALRMKVIDRPISRKIHTRIVARLGGIAIYLSFFITVGLTYLLNHNFAANFTPGFAGLFLGSSIILMLGIYDDFRGANASKKFFFQILAALVIIKYGFRIDLITNPFGGSLETGHLAIPITVIWLVAITNTINLIDGLDGLAAGVSSIVCLTLFLTGLYRGNVTVAILTAALVGSTLGFLKYNFSPAQIFMGDAGSLFLGFTLAAIAIKTSQKSATAVAIFIPIIAMGLPIFDTILAILRRLFKGAHLFHADNEHIHHWLLKMGLSHRKTVILLYLVTIILGTVAFIFTAVKDEYISFILFAMGIIVYVGIRKLGFIKFKQLNQNNKLGQNEKVSE